MAVHEGKTVFIEGAIPGEEVEVRILQEKKDILRARVSRVIKASPDRVEPVCPHTSHCGGCQYQHMRYEEELVQKESQVREVIRRALGFGAVEPIVRGPKEYGYRRSATFHTVPQGRGKAPRFSYIGKDNVTPVVLKQCDLLDPAIQKMITHAPLGATGKFSFKMSSSGKLVTDQKESFFRVNLSGKTFLAHSQSFFQNNWEVTEKMAALVREWTEDAMPDVFFDLYAGVGTFTFLAAENTGRVIAIEENHQAVSALRMNREEMNWKKLEVVENRVERAFQAVWKKAGTERSLVLFDPPRAGLDRGLCDFLASEVRAQRLIYISCDPATLARDLKILIEGGNYELANVVPFDMFPRTKHVEAAALLIYKGS